MTTPVIHIAGADVGFNNLLRQRCAWCGAILIDQDLTLVLVPEGTKNRDFPVWPVGSFVGVDGGMKFSVAFTNGSPFPAGLCALLDPAVTR